MNRDAPQRSVQQSPTPRQPPGSRVRSVLGIMHSRGWLRPRRIGCLLVVLVIATMWLAGRAVEGITAQFNPHPPPVPGSPFDPVAPARPVSSGSATIDRIRDRGRLIVAIQESPGLAQASSEPGCHTGFDIALFDEIAHKLGVETNCFSFKVVAASSRQGALARSEVDLVLAAHKITAVQPAEMSVAGPYLVRSGTEYVIGLPPGDPVLHDRIIAALQQVIDDGTWARLYRQYLGGPVPAPPRPR